MFFRDNNLMCSIFGILDIKTEVKLLRQKALKLSATMRHRGPDWYGNWNDDNAILVHERLAIVDMEHGSQPLLNKEKTHVLAVNGEIYNHQKLAEELAENTPSAIESYQFQTKSDCEIILALYQQITQHSSEQTGPEKVLSEESGNKNIADILDKLQGMFAFILYDQTQNTYLIARDHMGIIPLYYGYDEYGQFYVASEMKALTADCTVIKEFPPGHFLYSKNSIGSENNAEIKQHQIMPYYQRDWQKLETHCPVPVSAENLKQALEQSVKSHLMSDVPYGVLLSGGLDSSIIASITQNFAGKRVEDNDASPAWWPQIHSFAIGLEGSPDLVAAQKVANIIGTIHHELTFTVQDGLDALRDVIYHLETYDVTTIRASTPMYLMARKIKAMGIKMVLSGEGADEIFGGYLYFHKAPDAQEFHEETVRKLDRLHLFDCLRANKSMSAWGIEARVPFLDKHFLDLAMSIDAQHKMCNPQKIEKHILREAFDGELPDEILWRQKEQFSDGVGYSWIDSLKEHAEHEVSDSLLENAQFKFPYNTPLSKEAYLYRSIFAESFPQASAAETVPGGRSVACSTQEALLWDSSLNQTIDPSGRAVSAVHADSYA